MTLTKKELLDLKDKVEESKTATSELKGQQTAVLKQLKDEFNCSNTEEGEEEINKIVKSLTILNKKIEKESAILEAQFEEEEE
jgi:hypothetical protein